MGNHGFFANPVKATKGFINHPIEKISIDLNKFSNKIDSKGMNEYCHNVGFIHSTTKPLNPDPIGDGLEVFPCTLNSNTNKSYSNVFMQGYNLSKKN